MSMEGLPALARVRAPLRLLAGGAILALLVGCQSLPSLPAWASVRDADSFLGLITPYRMDIVQGNVVTREQAAQVKPGMTRAQVRDILGSPMLTDLFHADRWDYAFTIRRQGTPPQNRSVVAFFKGDRLERLEAPELPSERDFVASISRPGKGGPVPALELSGAQKQALPPPPKTPAAPAAAPAGPARDYPPLEPT
jgi:outer membrane protein assembly factor BamE